MLASMSNGCVRCCFICATMMVLFSSVGGHSAIMRAMDAHPVPFEPPSASSLAFVYHINKRFEAIHLVARAYRGRRYSVVFPQCNRI